MLLAATESTISIVNAAEPPETRCKKSSICHTSPRKDDNGPSTQSALPASSHVFHIGKLKYCMASSTRLRKAAKQHADAIMNLTWSIPY